MKMSDTPILTKQQFLENLEKALRLLICHRLNADADEDTRKILASDVAEFIRINASEYSLDELIETFTSYNAAIGLFYEYQEAKRIVDEASASPQTVLTTVSLRTAGDRWQETITGIIFVWVPGGSFMMGSGEWDDQSQTDELPVHEVWLDGFWMAQTPVTVGQYLIFAKNAPVHLPVAAASEPNAAHHEFPVVDISWHDAAAYARWLSKRSGNLFRLPSEGQWEYAARSGGRTEKYAGGDHVDAVAWYAYNSKDRLHRVAKKIPNGLGIHDMCGNICEWCLDHYDKSAYRKHDGHNPVIRLDEDLARVVRGGSYRYGARDVRCADRGLLVADRREPDVGFRLLRSA